VERLAAAALARRHARRREPAALPRGAALMAAVAAAAVSALFFFIEIEIKCTPLALRAERACKEAANGTNEETVGAAVSRTRLQW
jgi:hypothetical protein